MSNKIHLLICQNSCYLSTKKVTVALLYSRRNNDTINLESCADDDWLLMSSGETEISGYEYELVYSGPEYK